MNPTMNMLAKSINAFPKSPMLEIIPGRKTATVVTILPTLKQMPVYVPRTW
ncbi:MAG: hypothetical protein WDO15_29870 [Bacteroidota bacterium]